MNDPNDTVQLFGEYTSDVDQIYIRCRSMDGDVTRKGKWDYKI